MVVNSRVNQLWNEYALPRFKSQRADELRSHLEAEVTAAFLRLADEAKTCGAQLQFTEADLFLAVVQELGEACEYCGDLFGVDSWGVVRRNPLLRPARDFRRRGGDTIAKLQGSNVERAGFGIDSVAVCCVRCARPKRLFTDEQWRGLLAELRKCDDAVYRWAVGVLGGVVGTSPTLPRCG